MTCEEMLSRISSVELVQWRALFELEEEQERDSRVKERLSKAVK